MDKLTIFLKYVIIAGTTLITISTLLLVSYGVTATGSAGYPKFAYFAASIGFYLMAVGFVGTFAGLRESRILSLVFVGCSALGVFLLTIFMITFAAMKDGLFDATKTRLESAWEQQEANDTVLMNKVQNYYHCCGKDSFQDYLKDPESKLPETCCYDSDCSNIENIFSKGCHDEVMNTFHDRSENLLYSCLATILLIVLAAVAAYFFSKNVRDLKDPDIEIEEK